MDDFHFMAFIIISYDLFLLMKKQLMYVLYIFYYVTALCGQNNLNEVYPQQTT